MILPSNLEALLATNLIVVPLANEENKPQKKLFVAGWPKNLRNCLRMDRTRQFGTQVNWHICRIDGQEHAIAH